ncbi:hypothetical protein C8R47DRAFT_286665 [Mycena vitilis]|nr:hypothetical protein C8R47DRAFT_286665 [Mycena vitilis]
MMRRPALFVPTASGGCTEAQRARPSPHSRRPLRMLVNDEDDAPPRSLRSDGVGRLPGIARSTILAAALVVTHPHSPHSPYNYRGRTLDDSDAARRRCLSMGMTGILSSLPTAPTHTCMACKRLSVAPPPVPEILHVQLLRPLRHPHHRPQCSYLAAPVPSAIPPLLLHSIPDGRGRQSRRTHASKPSRVWVDPVMFSTSPRVVSCQMIGRRKRRGRRRRRLKRVGSRARRIRCVLWTALPSSRVMTPHGAR